MALVATAPLRAQEHALWNDNKRIRCRNGFVGSCLWRVRLCLPSVPGRCWTRAALLWPWHCAYYRYARCSTCRCAACRGAGDARMGRTLGPRSDCEFCSGSEREKVRRWMGKCTGPAFSFLLCETSRTSHGTSWIMPDGTGVAAKGLEGRRPARGSPAGRSLSSPPARVGSRPVPVRYYRAVQLRSSNSAVHCDG